jgi:hypothetical protein
MSATNRDSLFEPFAEGYGVDWLETSFIPQSLIFYAELLPIIYSCCKSVTNRPVRLCDIGAGSGAGSNLVVNYLNTLGNCPAEMTAHDLERRFSSYAAAMFPNIKYKIGDFFASSEQYDVAILSHTLEHIGDPEDFLQRLTARVPITVVYVPFREQDLIPGHVASFDENRIAAMPGMIWGRTFRSMGWAPHSVGVAAFVCVSPAARESINILQITEDIDAHFQGSRIQSPTSNLRANIAARPLNRAQLLVDRATRIIKRTARETLRPTK